jgi:hypothetical protein
MRCTSIARTLAHPSHTEPGPLTDLRRALEQALTTYAIEHELGRGGMATVFLARDLRHDRPVALKVLHPGLAHALGPERFQREVRMAARLQHPHILTVFDSGEADGHLWFTMPYVEGESLRNRLDPRECTRGRRARGRAGEGATSSCGTLVGWRAGSLIGRNRTGARSYDSAQTRRLCSPATRRCRPISSMHAHAPAGDAFSGAQPGHTHADDICNGCVAPDTRRHGGVEDGRGRHTVQPLAGNEVATARGPARRSHSSEPDQSSTA